jgi:hypothetical protein
LGINYANVNEPEGYLLTRPNKVKTKTQIISLFVVYPCQIHKGRGEGGGGAITLSIMTFSIIACFVALRIKGLFCNKLYKLTQSLIDN